MHAYVNDISKQSSNCLFIPLPFSPFQQKFVLISKQVTFLDIEMPPNAGYLHSFFFSHNKLTTIQIKLCKFPKYQKFIQMFMFQIC